jgi:hypothetical protein
MGKRRFYYKDNAESHFIIFGFISYTYSENKSPMVLKSFIIYFLLSIDAWNMFLFSEFLCTLCAFYACLQFCQTLRPQ